ncbi:tyrosine-type recombinase/integrase [Paeniroseomonas aquatica]|uniref:Tyrosine-type recombinase/integrase n=2 Tax=Paeniroseomonas aquatica TaxID=373043 RepID=A0ABT8A463_9PROT|nr:tyrosine-type recombinase/integrase [Paeniroseomonas aquatica]MDN3564344.1 tyrosine-type recombinase/integrase [Paeniroseomonas aquatica]
MISGVSVPAAAMTELLTAVVGGAATARITAGERGRSLEMADGVRFLFDRNGHYLNDVNGWQLRMGLRTSSPATRATRSSAIKRVLGWYDERGLRWQDCLELAHMNRLWLSFRSAESPLVSKATWNQWMDHWFAFVLYAKQTGLVDDIGFNRSDVIERGRSARPVRALSAGEFKTFVQAADSSRMRAGCAACLGTGMRVSELAALRLSDIPDPQSPSNIGRAYLPATIMGKGRKVRTIYWPSTAIKWIQWYVNGERRLAVETLRQRISKQEITASQTFLTVGSGGSLIEQSTSPLWLAENGEPLSQKRWGKDFAKVSDRCGKNGPQCSPHNLRHSYAIATLSLLINAMLKKEMVDRHLGREEGRVYFMEPIREVKERLGHASIDTTMIYLDHIAEHRALLSMAVSELQATYFDA